MRNTDPVNRLRTVIGRLAVASRPVRGPVLDLLVVLFVLSLSLGHESWNSPLTDRAAWFFDIALVLPLLLRRRWPGEVFAVLSALALAQWLMDVQSGGDVAFIWALYAVGVYETRRPVIIGAVVIAELGALMAAFRWHPQETENGLNNAVALTAMVIAPLALGFYIRTRRAYIVTVLERAATAERERDQQALIATVTERARISREMHDIVAHSLSVMIALGDGAAIAAARSPADARAAMLQSSALGRQALGEMRKLLGDLNGDEFDGEPGELAPQPGIGDLDALIKQVRAAGPEVELVIDGPPPELAPGAQLTIYRMVQEALTNVLKHAPGATRATVTLRYRATGVDIEIENDDRAVQVPAVPTESRSPGRGLTGMRQRAAAFGGKIEAGRRPTGGWRVSTHLELEDQNPR
jgi:signal transduction histidine kinase